MVELAMVAALSYGQCTTDGAQIQVVCGSEQTLTCSNVMNRLGLGRALGVRGLGVCARLEHAHLPSDAQQPREECARLCPAAAVGCVGGAGSSSSKRRLVCRHAVRFLMPSCSFGLF